MRIAHYLHYNLNMRKQDTLCILSIIVKSSPTATNPNYYKQTLYNVTSYLAYTYNTIVISPYRVRTYVDY